MSHYPTTVDLKKVMMVSVPSPVTFKFPRTYLERKI